MNDRLTLSNSLMAPFLPTVPVPTGSLIAFDGVSINDRFDIFAIYERPIGAPSRATCSPGGRRRGICRFTSARQKTCASVSVITSV